MSDPLDRAWHANRPLYDSWTYWHGGKPGAKRRPNMLFADGHVEFITLPTNLRAGIPKRQTRKRAGGEKPDAPPGSGQGTLPYAAGQRNTTDLRL
jgi:prepilin-type processing-associated H-X9-DG protein